MVVWVLRVVEVGEHHGQEPETSHENFGYTGV